MVVVSATLLLTFLTMALMFHHAVMFGFKPGTTDEQVASMIEGLGALPATIPTIRRYNFGRDAGVNAGNSDFAVVAEFDDRDGYLVYRDHPAHVTVVRERIAPFVAQRSAVQFER